MVDLKDENNRLREENSEIREMNIRLSNKLEECCDERDAACKDLERLKGEMEQLCMIMSDAVTCINCAVVDLKKVNDVVLSCRPLYGKSRSHRNPSYENLPDQESVVGGHAAVEEKVEIIGSCIKSLDAVVAEVAGTAEITHETLSLTVRGPLSEPELFKALHSKIAYQRGKLERASWLEMENGRLKRVLRSRRFAEVRIETRDAACQVEGCVMSSPLRGGRIKPTKPTVITMPCASNFNVNAELWPIRSIGVQCFIEQPHPPPSPTHHIPAPNYDAFLTHIARHSTSMSPMTPTRRPLSMSPSPTVRSGKAMPKRSSYSPSPSVRKVEQPKQQPVKKKKKEG
eukprot:TRINITY_DN23544_c0_g1_i2.p1 TRINITY_DN23544_c0_g1~~TRINITY_DN23544_c0_g1_i2.p1  ORF type:complete len:343 (+),score=25.44 TRINITY_DN23544_c0_g1_i2:86-1114(+)